MIDYDKLLTVLTEGINDPGILKAVFLFGGPGSGKSYMVRKLFGINPKIGISIYGLKYVSGDKELEFYLKRANLPLDYNKLYVLDDDEEVEYAYQHARAVSATKGLLDNFLKNRLGIISEYTLRDLSQASIQYDGLYSYGYDCMGIFINTPLEVAMRRNQERERKLTNADVLSQWQKAQHNRKYLANIFGKNLITIDNDDSNMINKQAISAIRQFVNHPVKNPIGQEWIKREKELRNV